MFLLPDQVYGEESHRLTVSSRPTMPPAAAAPAAAAVRRKFKDPESSSGCDPDPDDDVDSGGDPGGDTDGYGQEMSRLLSNLECWHSRHGHGQFSLAKISQKFEMKKQFSVKDEIWVDLPPPTNKDNKVVKTICRRKDSRFVSGRTICNCILHRT